MVSVEVSFLITAVVSTGIRRLTSAARKIIQKKMKVALIRFPLFLHNQRGDQLETRKKVGLGEKITIWTNQ